jgi:hypothetical protein
MAGRIVKTQFLLLERASLKTSPRRPRLPHRLRPWIVQIGLFAFTVLDYFALVALFVFL